MGYQKYREKILIGPVVVRLRDMLRQIAMVYDLQILSGKVKREHIHVFISAAFSELGLIIELKK
jgi:REP element-mobilizing transposase RayT